MLAGVEEVTTAGRRLQAAPSMSPVDGGDGASEAGAARESPSGDPTGRPNQPATHLNP